jgi:hypothetical protein
MAEGPLPVTTVAGDFGISFPVAGLMLYCETSAAGALIGPVSTT